MRTITFFASATDTTPTAYLSAADALHLIQSDQATKAATAAIIEQFGDAIEAGFPDGKKAYQDAKRDTLAVAAFSGTMAKRGKEQPESFVHSGLVTLDNDGNGLEAQKRLWSAVQGLECVHSAAMSVSGALTGDFFTNVAVEIPDGVHGAELAKLHTDYHDFAAETIASLTGTTAAKGGGIDRLRYLAHDAGVFIRPEGEIQPLTYAQLEKWRTGRKKAKKARTAAQSVPIGNVGQTGQEFAMARAVEFAKNAGYSFVDGQIHNFRIHLAIHLNWLGVPRWTADSMIQTAFPAEIFRRGDVTKPYETYAGDFGNGAHILADHERERRATQAMPAPEVTRLQLARGQYLSEHAAHLAALLEEHGRIDLQAGTGSGKSYAVAVELPKYTGGRKVVIACSLNAKVEKDAAQYGCAAVTGKMLKGTEDERGAVWAAADAADVVLCSYEQAHKVCARYPDAVVAIDEAHSLSYSYRGAALARMWAAVQSHQLICMSGTPLPYLPLLGFHTVIVSATRANIRWHLRNRIKGELASTAVEHIEATDLDARRVVCMIQSKAQLDLAAKMLVKEGKCKPEQVVVLYSDDEVKASDEFKQLIQAAGGGESFADAVRVVLTTSLIGEGVDVYSAMPVDFVIVEQQQKFNPLQVVQFSDRWRTSSDRNAYTYVLTADEPDAWKKGDNYKAGNAFFAGYTHYSSKANMYNLRADEVGATCADERLIDTGSAFSELQKFVVRDEAGKYVVSVPALIQDTETERALHRTQDSAVQELLSAYPYFKLIDERQKPSKESKERAAMGAEVKEARKAARNALARVLQADRPALLAAIASKTQDTKLRRALKKQTAEDVNEDAEIMRQTGMDTAARAAALQAAHPDLFSKLFGYTEGVAKRLVQARKLGVTGADYTRIATKVGELASAKKVSAFIAGLRLHILLMLYAVTVTERENTGSAARSLTVQQAADAERLASFVRELQGKQGQRLTRLQLKGLADRCMGRKKYTMAQAQELAGFFMGMEYDRPAGAAEGSYLIGEQIGFSDYLTLYNVQDKKPIKNTVVSVVQLADFQGRQGAKSSFEFSYIKT